MVRLTVTILRLSALLALALGILFWTGHADSLVSAHMVLGLLVALSLWGLGIWVLEATLAIKQQGNWWLAGGALALAGTMLIFGLVQERACQCHFDEKIPGLCNFSEAQQ